MSSARPRFPAAGTELWIAAALLLASALARLPTFWRSVLDWDESLYFLMAVQWRAGHLPYTTIWDNKPVGIYAIFALAQAVFGPRVAAMRVASVMASALAAYAVTRITRRLAPAGGLGAALFAGFTYILCSLSNDGLAANTEPFMACCTALAVWAAGSGWGGRRPRRQALVTGLLLGAAFMIKYVAVFEAPAVLLLLLSRHRRVGLGGWAGLSVICVAGAAAPLAATICLYWQAHALPLWWSASVASNFRRIGAAVSPGALRYAARIELLRWGPLLLAALAMLAVAVLRLARRRGDNAPLFLAAWLLGGCVGVAAAKSFYDHYFLQILPVLCVTAGWGAARLAVALPARRRRPVLACAAIGFLALPAWAAWVALAEAAAPVLAVADGRLVIRPDMPRAVAHDLAAQLAITPGVVYLFDGQPIIYGLIGQTPPTRYVFPSVLTTRFLARVAGVDAPKELARIMATRPLFVIRNNSPLTDPKIADVQVYAILNAALAAHYTLWRSYHDASVYRLR